MKRMFLFTVAAIAALSGATATVRAQEMGFANLTDPTSLVVLAAENDSDYPFKLCNVENVLDATACCGQPRFETTASLLFLKPSSGSLEYGTLVYPLPPPSPHWENQTISPSYSPAFNVGVRYFVPETGNDLRTSWTHLATTDSASFSGGVTNFAGPPYLIGPGATAYNRGTGTVNFGYDAVNAEAGHLF